MATYALQLSDAEIGRYLGMAEHAATAEADLWALAGIAPGARVADVGCGPGAVLARLAAAVAPTGSAVGVDADAGVLDAARSLLDAAGASNVRVVQGRADDTGLERGSLDVVMLRHVLAHNGGAEQRIVDHIAGLLRPGGVVYLVDVDLTAMRLRPVPDGLGDLAERYVRFHSERGNDPSVGLRLQELALGAGLEVVTYRGRFDIIAPPPGMRPPPWAAREAMVAAGVATPADVQRWGDALDRLDASAERPLMFAPLFLLLARRPSA